MCRRAKSTKEHRNGPFTVDIKRLHKQRKYNDKQHVMKLNQFHKLLLCQAATSSEVEARLR
jgi:hypothetical protein